MSQFHYDRKERLARRNRRPTPRRSGTVGIYIIAFDCLLIALVVIVRNCSVG